MIIVLASKSSNTDSWGRLPERRRRVDGGEREDVSSREEWNRKKKNQRQGIVTHAATHGH